MAEAPRLPRSLFEWVCLFGPGAIMASLTIGTGELVFSSRGGSLFGYRILFVFALISVLKWVLVISTSRHMILTGVHPYERMLDLPGPRGWMPIMLFLMSVVCLPVWISFHSSVLGNLTSWTTGTSHLFHGGIDYVWGAAILASVLILSATGGYAVLEKTQTAVVLAMVACACISLVLYRPDWLQLAFGLFPQPLSYPTWLADSYPEIARHSVWVETTRYMGVIGGAGFDYLAYTSWLREKHWGVLPERATKERLLEIAADPQHEVRRWINAPLVDCSISFLLVIVFSAVFVASGAIFLGPSHMVPNEENLLNLQAEFVTKIHPLLLPLYIVGAFLTMLGTLYGTVEIACSVADEIGRSINTDWPPQRAMRLRQWVIVWCASLAFLILGWLFIRQSTTSLTNVSESSIANQDREKRPSGKDSGKDEVRVEKPRLILAVMTPVNLFTGVLSCGLICVMTFWMDRRWLPAELRPPLLLTCFNLLAGILFLALGVKGYWENENRVIAVSGFAGLLVVSIVIAWLVSPILKSQRLTSQITSGDSPS